MGQLKGMEAVMTNLNVAILKIEAGSMKGLIEASIIIRRDMERTPPLVPVDTGNLRASWFTTPIKVTGMPGLLIGFNANYAIFVHEMGEGEDGTPVNWNRPNSGAKFFEAALSRNAKVILQTIQKNAYIK